MKRVGKIDRTIYSCVTEDIITNKVVLTKNRIKHVKDKHGNDYKNLKRYLKKVVEKPDYILEDKRPYTAVILKRVGEHRLLLALRIATHLDKNYKNSIITFFKIDKYRWDRYIRRKKILYKAK